MIQQIINNEKFTNIQKAQGGLTKLFKSASQTGSFFRVMKNDEPLGVLIPNDFWEELTEDLEALSSPAFRNRIAAIRSENGQISSKEAKKLLGL